MQAISNPMRTLPANLPDSGGFEGLALNKSGTRLYALLEKAINGDPVRTRLIISEFSLGQRKYTGKTFAYPLDAPTNAIGDFTALTDREFMIIERDGGQGDAQRSAPHEPGALQEDLPRGSRRGGRERRADQGRSRRSHEHLRSARCGGEWPHEHGVHVPLHDDRRRAGARQQSPAGHRRQQLPGLGGPRVRRAGQQRVHRDPRGAAARLRRGRRRPWQTWPRSAHGKRRVRAGAGLAPDHAGDRGGSRDGLQR